MSSNNQNKESKQSKQWRSNKTLSWSSHKVWMWSLLPDTILCLRCLLASEITQKNMFDFPFQRSAWLLLAGIVVVKVACFSLSGVECSKGRSFNINQLLISPKPRRAALNLHHFIASVDHLFLCIKAWVSPPWKQNSFSINCRIIENFGLRVTFKAHLVQPMAGQCLEIFSLNML